MSKADHARLSRHVSYEILGRNGHLTVESLPHSFNSKKPFFLFNLKNSSYEILVGNVIVINFCLLDNTYMLRLYIFLLQTLLFPILTLFQNK
jgi:hypothetical protein